MAENEYGGSGEAEGYDGGRGFGLGGLDNFINSIIRGTGGIIGAVRGTGFPPGYRPPSTIQPGRVVTGGIDFFTLAAIAAFVVILIFLFKKG